MTDDKVDHPAHYNTGKIEVIDFIEDQKLGFHEGNVVKYVTRAKHKGTELEDLRKAAWYLNRAIARLDGTLPDLEESMLKAELRKEANTIIQDQAANPGGVKPSEDANMFRQTPDDRVHMAPRSSQFCRTRCGAEPGIGGVTKTVDRVTCVACLTEFSNEAKHPGTIPVRTIHIAHDDGLLCDVSSDNPFSVVTADPMAATCVKCKRVHEEKPFDYELEPDERGF